jgi:hypothetical protein
MKLGIIIPWLCVVASLGAAGWFYSASQKKEADLAALRADSEQLQQARAELEETKKAQSQSANDELVQLRAEHQELLRLRNEVRQLRGDKQQLSGQVQAAQAQVANAQAQAQAQAQALRAAQAAPAVPPDQQAAAALAARAAAQPAVSPEQAKVNACVFSLRLIDAAKQQWAAAKQKPNGAILISGDLLPYLPNNTMPACPAGGVYTLNPIGQSAICNIPGHAAAR